MATTASLRNRDPCGDILSYQAAVTANLANINNIHVPTLVLTGGKDAIYPVPATKQASLLTGSTDVTPITLPDTGHALTLHRTADLFAANLSTWLTEHHFGGWAMPVGAPATGGGSTAAAHHDALLTPGIVLLAAGATLGLILTYRRRDPHSSAR